MKQIPACKLYLEGYCKQGNRCKFSHDHQASLQIDSGSNQSQYSAINFQTQKKFKPFIEITKTSEGKEIFLKNQLLYKNPINGEGNFIICLKQSQNLRTQEILKLFRRFQSSFEMNNSQTDSQYLLEILDQKVLQFQIKYVPTISRADLSLDVDVVEGYFVVQIYVPGGYPDEPCVFQIVNQSLPEDTRRDISLLFNRIESNQGKPYSILRTLQFIDNKFDKFCDELKNVRIITSQEQEIPQKIIIPKLWSQQEQTKFEEALAIFKIIAIKEDKWIAISNYVGTRDVAECLARFQYCKQQSLERLNQQNNKSDSEDEEDDDQEEEEDSEQDERENEESDKEYQEGQKEGSNSDNEEGQIEQKGQDQFKDDSYLKVLYNQTFEVEELFLENISLIEFTSIQVFVECKRCHLNSEITLEENNEYPTGYLINKIPCSECNTLTKSFFRKSFIHPNNYALGTFGSFTWKVKYIIKCSMTTTCHQCVVSLPISNYISGKNQQAHCRHCFEKGQFSYVSIKVENFQLDGIQNKNISQEIQPELEINIYRPKKVGVFKAGAPLPQQGACKHYKSSHRWYRFPCCGKAYPCDNCHFDQEKHEMEIGKNMICGFCSQEQIMYCFHQQDKRKVECQRCHQATCQITSGQPFWEGGKGVRNRTTLSINDSHKYKGLNKTVSRKKQLQASSK